MKTFNLNLVSISLGIAFTVTSINSFSAAANPLYAVNSTGSHSSSLNGSVNGGTSAFLYDNGDKSFNKLMIVDKLQQGAESQDRKDFETTYGIQFEWFEHDGSLTEEGKKHIYQAENGTFKSEVHLTKEEKVKFSAQKGSTADSQPTSNNSEATVHPKESSSIISNNSQPEAEGKSGEIIPTPSEKIETKERVEDASSHTELPKMGSATVIPATPTLKMTEARDTTEKAKPVMEIKAEQNLASATSAFSGTLSDLSQTTRAMATSFFNNTAVVQDQSAMVRNNAQYFVSYRHYFVEPIGIDKSDLRRQPSEMNVTTPNVNTYVDYAYHHYTLKNKNFHSKIHRNDITLGGYAQINGYNLGLAMISMKGNSTTLNNYTLASKVKMRTNGLLATFGWAFDKSYLNLGAYAVFSKVNTSRSPFGNSEQHASFNTQQYALDIVYGRSLYQTENSSILLNGGLTNVYYHQDSFNEQTDSQNATPYSLQVDSSAYFNSFAHLGMQASYQTYISSFTTRSDIALRVEQALTANRFDLKLQDGTTITGSKNDKFTVRLSVGQTFIFDKVSIRVGAEFIEGNRTNARLDTVSATLSYRF
ncbi:autotransporter outer membrane beta-barrel domain-containing protein [Avibacterium paragallinarum]|uniref:autotransporter outer membrane beta-barrel domain-containing protein n=1 Tax=Avibacterium paragallinarum TaxID=728 RepID=UPI0006149F75|nr:autotransporter outer membrane beta-barrel domain-containing protein [Avibacterium paragallinarum]QIR11689.1 autotransporter outer membrane beta-barrel domain-containing protein [Avibacterium paragallinarum]QLD64575.1 autotransporter outer membrane beta-barrel domain-containing protein [Avibacterium paragallinarum]